MEILAIDGLAVVTSGKTISDHIVSYGLEKNCSTIRRQTGQNYCEEDDFTTPEEIYCYKSLGSVDCFESPQPYGQKTQTIDHIPGKSNLVR